MENIENLIVSLFFIAIGILLITKRKCQDWILKSPSVVDKIMIKYALLYHYFLV